MSSQPLRWTATAAAATSAAAGVAVFWLAARLPALLTGDPAGSVAVAPSVIGMVLLAGTGALVLQVRPRAVIGWLLVAVGLLGVLGPLTLALAVLAHEHGHPAAAVLGWVTNWSWVPAQTLALLLLLRFPDGSLPRPRWRSVQAAVVGWGAITGLVTAVLPGPLGAEVLAPRTNPVGLGVPADTLDPLLDVLFLVQPVLLLAAALAPVRRWRGASPAERRQLRAVAFAVLLVAVAAPLALASGAGVVLEGVAWLALPAAIAYAVARHDLWDLDLRRRFDRLRRVREEERARLQRDLHDSLGPLLGSIAMRVEAARNLVAASAAPQEVDRVLASIGSDAETAVVEVRRFIDELAPTALDDADLGTALRRLVDGYAGSGLRIELRLPAALPPLDTATEIAVYRVAGEALRNAVRHSGATRCEVVLTVTDRDLELVVADDGGGLRGEPAGVGRRAMADRVQALGGALDLVEPDQGGVVVRATLREAVA